VAIVEITLYIAWSSRNERKVSQRREMMKKMEPPDSPSPVAKESQVVDSQSTLRKRKQNNLDG
jgi:hypothetical protein